MVSEHMGFGITIGIPDGTTMNLSACLIGLDDRNKELEQALAPARALLERWMSGRACGGSGEYVAVHDQVREDTEAFLAQHKES